MVVESGIWQVRTWGAGIALDQRTLFLSLGKRRKTDAGWLGHKRVETPNELIDFFVT